MIVFFRCHISPGGLFQNPREIPAKWTADPRKISIHLIHLLIHLIHPLIHLLRKISIRLIHLLIHLIHLLIHLIRLLHEISIHLLIHLLCDPFIPPYRLYPFDSPLLPLSSIDLEWFFFVYASFLLCTSASVLCGADAVQIHILISPFGVMDLGWTLSPLSSLSFTFLHPP